MKRTTFLLSVLALVAIGCSSPLSSNDAELRIENQRSEGIMILIEDASGFFVDSFTLGPYNTAIITIKGGGRYTVHITSSAGTWSTSSSYDLHIVVPASGRPHSK